MTVICGALLKKCLDLLERGVHPTVISDAFNKAAERAVEVHTCCHLWCFLKLAHALLAEAIDWASTADLGESCHSSGPCRQRRSYQGCKHVRFPSLLCFRHKGCVVKECNLLQCIGHCNVYIALWQHLADWQNVSAMLAFLPTRRGVQTCNFCYVLLTTCKLLHKASNAQTFLIYMTVIFIAVGSILVQALCC